MQLSFIFYILIAILVLMVMITIHEAGHYVAGKILKFKINEFSIGFGPAIFSKTNKTTGEKFSIRLIPLGGFCAFEDEEGLSENKQPEEPFEEDVVKEETPIEEDKNAPKAFVKQAPWKRIIVLISGGLANILSAFIFSLIFLLVVGRPSITPVVADIAINPDTGVGYNQELVVGDKIIAVDGIAITEEKSYDYLISKAGENLTFTVIRNGENVTINVVKQTISYENPDGTITTSEGKIGFSASYEYVHDVGYAFREFVPFTFDLSFAVIKALFMLFTGQVPVTQMTGTVGTIDEMAKMTQMNWRNLFLLLPLLASNLGIFNLLPIPALDGSKVVFTTIEWIRKKPISRKVESYIHMAGLFLLLGFVLIIDVLHFIL
ncbi:MAG: site-2 protease family protein [Clostridiales bacterium]|nr:site-2 protease family protein [Clostridiales bacterium]